MGVQRQFLYFCTSKASKVRTWRACRAAASLLRVPHLRKGNLDVGAQRQYLYFCTSKASKVSTWRLQQWMTAWHSIGKATHSLQRLQKLQQAAMRRAASVFVLRQQLHLSICQTRTHSLQQWIGIWHSMHPLCQLLHYQTHSLQQWMCGWPSMVYA